MMEHKSNSLTFSDFFFFPPKHLELRVAIKGFLRSLSATTLWLSVTFATQNTTMGSATFKMKYGYCGEVKVLPLSRTLD